MPCGFGRMAQNICPGADAAAAVRRPGRAAGDHEVAVHLVGAAAPFPAPRRAGRLVKNGQSFAIADDLDAGAGDPLLAAIALLAQAGPARTTFVLVWRPIRPSASATAPRSRPSAAMPPTASSAATSRSPGRSRSCIWWPKARGPGCARSTGSMRRRRARLSPAAATSARGCPTRSTPYCAPWC